jgi:hypothetical protein
LPQAKRRLLIAKQYQLAAHQVAKQSGSAPRNVASGNAVLAAIAAADALCCSRLGLRSSSKQHHDAVGLLQRVDAGLARDLSILVSDKAQAHYGDDFIGASTLKAALRAMDRLVAAADHVISN